MFLVRVKCCFVTHRGANSWFSSTNLPYSPMVLFVALFNFPLPLSVHPSNILKLLASQRHFVDCFPLQSSDNTAGQQVFSILVPLPENILHLVYFQSVIEKGIGECRSSSQERGWYGLCWIGNNFSQKATISLVYCRYPSVSGRLQAEWSLPLIVQHK